MDIPIPIPTQEEDISVPLSSSNSSYAEAAAAAAVSHILHHPVPSDLHHNHLTAPPLPPAINNNNPDREVSPDHHHHHVVKNVVKYRECLKNHAAAMGGNATDGCGEFMPSGEEGSIEALTCSACNCHRNFHRKEMEGDHHHLQPPPYDWPHSYGHSPQHLNRLIGRKQQVIHHHNNIPPHDALVYPTGAVIAASRGPTPHQMIMPYNMAAAAAAATGSLPSTESDEQVQEDGGGHHLQMVKKRFRTKFTLEQKEKMLNFADKVGWKIQRQEESVVQHFCQEIGVKRRVLKVWMHNNKHNLAKKQTNNTNFNHIN